jgi:quercetin dioxygenase-like cupin family protein
MTNGLASFDLAREIAGAEAEKPWPSGIRVKVLCKNADFRAILISMEAAARMKEHRVDGTSSVQVLKGKIRYSAQGEAHELGIGSLLTVDASIMHEVEALEESAFLLTVSWPDAR